MSLMFAGLTIANVLGVPGGTALGQALGWRASFGCVALIGASLGGVAYSCGATPTRGSKCAREFRVLVDARVLLGMAMSAASAASFSRLHLFAPISKRHGFARNRDRRAGHLRNGLTFAMSWRPAWRLEPAGAIARLSSRDGRTRAFTHQT